MKTLETMWKQLNNKRVSQVARENNLSPQQLVALFDLAGLTGRRVRDPSPREIKERARKIREKGFGRFPPWSEETEKTRWIAARKIQGLV